MKVFDPLCLQRARERKKISRKVLSELCGLSKGQVGRFERGEREPRASDIILLADALGVSADELLGTKIFKKNFQSCPIWGTHNKKM